MAVGDGAVAWAMVEASPDALVMADEHGVIELVNRQAEVLFGYDRGELLGRPIETLVPDELAQVHQAHRTRFRVAPEVRSMGTGMDLLGRRADGTHFPVEISLSPLQVQGQLRVIAAVRDISERVTADAHSSLIQATIDATHDAVFMFPAESMRFTYVNQGAVDQTGYERDELLSMTPVHIKPEYTAGEFREMIAPLVAGEVPRVTFETVHRSKGGVDVPVEIVLEYPHSGHPGAERVLVAVVRDISERVATERALRRQEALNGGLSEVRDAMLKGGTRVDGLTLVCETAKTTLDASVAMIVAPTGNGDDICIEAAAGLSDSVRSALSLKTTEGVVGEVFRTGIAQFTGAGDPRIGAANQRIVAELRATSVIEAPLIGSGNDVVGVLVVVRNDRADPLDDDDLDFIVSFASQAVVAIEVAALRESQARAELLEDRDRIGRDMHDKVIGRLFSTGMTIQAIVNRVSDTDCQDKLLEAMDEIDVAIKEIRTAVYGVRFQADWGQGVRGEILAIAADQNEALGFEPHVNLAGPIDELDPAIVDHVLAVLREALTNTAKYAQASSVTIDMTVTDDNLTLEVVDDGNGFDTTISPGGANLTSHGLVNMALRAESLKGTATVTSRPGEGTTVLWTVPLA